MASAPHSRPVESSQPVDFIRPPVTETILGVQFAALERFTLPYVGLLWSAFRERYPNQEVKPPLSPVVEQFGPPRAARMGIEVTTDPDARFWFIDDSGTQLIQVQRDRFIRNWRKGLSPQDAYPRYDDLRPRFERDWEDFLSFLRHENLGLPSVNQCEVTYINHIELGRGWNSWGEAHKVLAFLDQSRTRRFLPEAEGFVLNVRYLLPGQRGRLHVASQPAIRRDDGKPVMQLTLTARGKPASSNLNDIVQWFNLGHEWIVRGFVDITTEAMHELWGKR